MKTLLVFCCAMATAFAFAESGDNERPPEPPGGFTGERPPEPPGGFGRHSGRRHGQPPQGGRGSRGGGMRDDPSDPSRYSGVVTVDSGTETFAGREFVSDKANVSPLYAKNGGVAVVRDATFDSTAANANAVLAIGKGSRVSVSNAVIKTTADSSRGLYALQGGEIEAWNVKISTRGAHCAAMATDRGRGKVTVCGGELNTAGDGSPCIYATGELAARNVTGTATGSEAMVIEGRNSITLENAQLTGERKCGAMIYQSFSGDAETGVGRLAMKSSTLTALTGPMFFVTNTRAEIDLERCTLVNRGKGPLVKLAPARWGRTGSNGGSLVMTARSQILEGDIEVSEISDFKLVLEQGASYRGAVNADGKGRKVEIVVRKGATLDLAEGSVAQVVRE